MQGAESWRFKKDGQVLSVRPQGRFKAYNGVALAAAAIQGLGIAALPDLLIKDAIASGGLVTVLEVLASLPVLCTKARKAALHLGATSCW